MGNSEIWTRLVVGGLCICLFGGAGFFLLGKTDPKPVASPAPLPSPKAVREQAKPIDKDHERWLRQAEDAHALLENSLFDYESAKFKNVEGVRYITKSVTLPRDYVLCGLINSKNRMGAYTGYKLFSITYDEFGDTLRFHVRTDSDIIAWSFCTGRGSFGERMAARHEAERAESPANDGLMAKIDAAVAGREEVATVSEMQPGKYDYSGVIGYSHSVGSARKFDEIWP